MASYDQISKNNWRYRISLVKMQKLANMNTSLRLALNVNQTLNIVEMIGRQLRNGDYIAPSSSIV